MFVILKRPILAHIIHKWTASDIYLVLKELFCILVLELVPLCVFVSPSGSDDTYLLEKLAARLDSFKPYSVSPIGT